MSRIALIALLALTIGIAVSPREWRTGHLAVKSSSMQVAELEPETQEYLENLKKALA